MTIKINGSAKEITALVLGIQERLNIKDFTPTDSDNVSCNDPSAED